MSKIGIEKKIRKWRIGRKTGQYKTKKGVKEEKKA